MTEPAEKISVVWSLGSKSPNAFGHDQPLIFFLGNVSNSVASEHDARESGGHLLTNKFIFYQIA